MHLQTFHIMADIHIDIERMIMHSNYLLEVDNSSASNGLSDMERKQYLDQIKELVQTVQTLLDANIALGNKQKELQAEADRKIAGLQDQVDKLTGELQARRRKMHGKNNGMDARAPERTETRNGFSESPNFFPTIFSVFAIAS